VPNGANAKPAGFNPSGRLQCNQFNVDLERKGLDAWATLLSQSHGIQFLCFLDFTMGPKPSAKKVRNVPGVRWAVNLAFSHHSSRFLSNAGRR
jgi:hypothetical protein